MLDADGQTATFTTAASFADGKFHQLVLSYAGASDAVIVYLDGQLIGGALTGVNSSGS